MEGKGERQRGERERERQLEVGTNLQWPRRSVFRFIAYMYVLWLH